MATKKTTESTTEEVKATKTTKAAPKKAAATKSTTAKKTTTKSAPKAETAKAEVVKTTTKKTTAKKASNKVSKAPTIKSCDCIIRPILTEESMNNMQNLNKITVEVYKYSNKVEIKNAFESIFGVKVSKVNTSYVRNKYKRVGKYSGTTSSYKKAIVTLAEGQSLDLLKSK